MLASGGEEEITGGDEALLVGEADLLAGEDSGVGRFKTRDSNNGGDDEVGIRQRGYENCARGPVDDFCAGDPGGLKTLGELRGKLFCRDGDEARAPALALGEGFFEVGTGSKSYRLESFGVRLTEA